MLDLTHINATLAGAPRAALTRETITALYDIDGRGRIHSPGPYEGQLLYLPQYWEAAQSGYADEARNGVWLFRLSVEDRTVWPELRGADRLYLTQGEAGCIFARTLQPGEADLALDGGSRP